MIRKESKIWLSLLLPALFASCGSPGVPLPPSLELARPVTDLHAFRKGEQVFLTWTIPTQTTERQNLRHGGVVDVCRTIDAAITRCGTPVAQVPFQRVPRNAPANQKTGTYTDRVPSAPSPTSNFVYAVSVLNSYNRSAGLSNQVQVPAASTLQPPSDFRAQLTAEGVQFSWHAGTVPEIAGLRFVYRVYRREQGTNKNAIAGELPANDRASTGLLDRSFEWEKTYDYRATVVTMIQAANGTEQQVEGDDTPSVQVVAHDVFPPATPSGLQAVFSGPGQKPFIDLVWTPNTEADLAGYNVYRHEEGGQPVKLNSDLIKSPDFRDAAIVPGHHYFYSVSAADVRGNESPHSEEASETVPTQ
jgi:hypothetical protein